MILFVCAVRQEASVLPDLRQVTNQSPGGRRFEEQLWQGRLQGRPVLLLQTGMGMERACAGLHAILDAYPVSLVIGFGFAGATVDELGTGDLVLCSSFHLDPGPALERGGSTSRDLDPGSAPAIQADPALMEIALRRADVRPQTVDPSCQINPTAGSSPNRPTIHASPMPALHVYGCVTVDHAVTHPVEKRELARRLPVGVIDMESYALAQVARRRAPFICLRAVSDDVNTALPGCVRRLRPDGTVHWAAALRDLAAAPTQLLELLQLARGARRARAALSAGLPALLSTLV